MRVLLNSDSSKLLKELRASAAMMDHDAPTLKTIPRQKSLPPKVKSMSKHLSLPNVAAAPAPAASQKPEPSQSFKVIQVKSPEIKVSATFRQKLRSLRGVQFESISGGSVSNRDPTSDQALKKAGFFMTLERDGSDAGPEQHLLEQLKKRMEKRIPKEGAAEVEFKYQKVLERYNTHQEKHQAILRNIRKKSESLEKQTVEQAEKIRKFLDSEMEGYHNSFRQTSSKFRRQERVLRLLELKYAKVWEYNPLAAMSAPKKIKLKYEAAKKGGSMQAEQTAQAEADNELGTGTDY